MLYFAAFLALALVLCAIYGAIVMLEIPGLAEERLGRLEPLPPLDEWQADDRSPEGRAASARGHVREVRVFRDATGGFLGRGRLIRQVRERDPRTDEVVCAEPDRPFRRRRVRSAG